MVQCSDPFDQNRAEAVTAPLVAVTALTPGQVGVAQRLAENLTLPFLPSVTSGTPGFLLLYANGHLELRRGDHPREGGVYADFLQGKTGHRARTSRGQPQPIARAVGLKPGQPRTVLDSTAGLGADAFLLAVLGATVTMVERSPIVAALLQDGLERLAQADPVAGSLTLVQRDGSAFMTSGPGHDVVYLDPMYPELRGSALQGKALRLLRDVVGSDPDARELLTTALGYARSRVVVKRPLRAPPLGDQPPHHAIVGTTTRFDVYQVCN